MIKKKSLISLVYILGVCFFIIGCSNNSKPSFSQVDNDTKKLSLCVIADEALTKELKASNKLEISTYGDAIIDQLDNDEYEYTNTLHITHNKTGTVFKGTFKVKIKMNENFNKEKNVYTGNAEEVEVNDKIKEVADMP